MPSKKSLSLAACLSLLTSLTQAQVFANYSSISNVSSSACPQEGGAHIIVARASTEPLGYGIIGTVKDSVIGANPASNAQYVVYPATLTDYFNSESAGVLAMRDLVEAFLAQDCANDPPIVLMGYSQGAQVASDFLSGQNVENFPFNSSLSQPASQETLSRIAAVITMGDPSMNVTDNAFHVGSSTQPGIFERFVNASMVLDGIGARMRYYCDAGDTYCASAGNFDNILVHLSYVQEYGEDAAQFVEQKISEYYANASGNENETASGDGSGSGSATESTGAAAGMKGMLSGSAMAMVLAVGIALLSGL